MSWSLEPKPCQGILTWHDLNWLDLSWPKLNWPFLTLHALTLLDLAWPDLIWPDLTWTDLTWPHLTWPDLTWPPELTSPELTCPDSIWPYLTWLDLISETPVGGQLSCYIGPRPGAYLCWLAKTWSWFMLIGQNLVLTAAETTKWEMELTECSMTFFKCLLSSQNLSFLEISKTIMVKSPGRVMTIYYFRHCQS